MRLNSNVGMYQQPLGFDAHNVHENVNLEKLKTDIERIKRDLADGAWTKNTYEPIDNEYMASLVGAMNSARHVDDQLIFVRGPKEFSEKLSEKINLGLTSASFIVGSKANAETGMSGHFAAFSYRMIDGVPSVLMLESASLNNSGPSNLAVKANIFLKKQHIENLRFSALDIDIQKGTGCGIYSLLLAKKMQSENDAMLNLHAKNAAGKLTEDSSFVASSEKIDKSLPPSFYKHTQSRRRLEKYLQANPESASVLINKKNETLEDRMARHLERVDSLAINGSDGLRSNTLHKKRLIFLEKLTSNSTPSLPEMTVTSDHVQEVGTKASSANTGEFKGRFKRFFNDLGFGKKDKSLRHTNA